MFQFFDLGVQRDKDPSLIDCLRDAEGACAARGKCEEPLALEPRMRPRRKDEIKRIAATLVAVPFALPTDFKGLARPDARLTRQFDLYIWRGRGRRASFADQIEKAAGERAGFAAGSVESLPRSWLRPLARDRDGPCLACG
jgi:hypothetical protein